MQEHFDTVVDARCAVEACSTSAGCYMFDVAVDYDDNDSFINHEV